MEHLAKPRKLRSSAPAIAHFFYPLQRNIAAFSPLIFSQKPYLQKTAHKAQ